MRWDNQPTNSIMIRKKKISFANFLSRFPEIDLPVTLTDEIEREIATRHDPIPPAMVEEFLGKFFPAEFVDEFTEFVPCFRLKETEKFHAVVVWVAELTKKQFYLITFNDKAEALQSKIIGGMVIVGDKILRTAAHIDQDWLIHTVSGIEQTGDRTDEYRETISTVIELHSGGTIVQNQ